MNIPRLHVVTDDAVVAAPGFVPLSIRLIEAAGPDLAFHIRGHATAARTLFRMAAPLAGAARANDARLLVNDRLDVALAAGAHGVQLGRRSVSVRDARALVGHGFIGYSAHDGDECGRAQRDGADFVLIGTVFESASHPGAAAGGLALVDDAIAAARVPVIGIGGMRPAAVSVLAAHGAQGVAVLGGVWHTRDPLRAMREWIDVVGAAPWKAATAAREHAAQTAVNGGR